MITGSVFDLATMRAIQKAVRDSGHTTDVTIEEVDYLPDDQVCLVDDGLSLTIKGGHTAAVIINKYCGSDERPLKFMMQN